MANSFYDFSSSGLLSQTGISSIQTPTHERALVRLIISEIDTQNANSGHVNGSQRCMMLYKLIMNHNDNRFSANFMKAVNFALDHVEKSFTEKKGTPAALIVSSSNPKIFSNGLVLEEAFKTGPSYFSNYHQLLIRILTFPMPTIAAINGHAFAGGCMFALAHDYRVMRKDAGFLCLNEVDLPGPLTPGMASIIKCKVKSAAVLRKMIMEGHRFPGPECYQVELVDALGDNENEIMEKATEIAKRFSWKVAHKKVGGQVYQYLKKEIHRQVIEDLNSSSLGFVADFAGFAHKKSKL